MSLVQTALTGRSGCVKFRPAVICSIVYMTGSGLEVGTYGKEVRYPF